MELLSHLYTQIHLGILVKWFFLLNQRGCLVDSGLSITQQDEDLPYTQWYYLFYCQTHLGSCEGAAVEHI